MATNLLLRRGTAAEATTYTGGEGELFVDLDNNQVYVHDGVNAGGVPLVGGASIVLSDLSVGPEGTASGDGSIDYDNTTGVFTYTPPVIPSDLTDLSISDGTNGQILTTDGAGNFSFTTVGGVSNTLDGLTDVTITSVADGEVLAYDSGTSSWVNTAASGGIALTDLSVGAEGTASGDGAIAYDNTTGVFTYTPADVSGYALTSSLAAVATTGAYSDLTGTPTLSAVATSGSYGDLTGTPSLATVAISGAYSDLSGTPILATVATSGSYTDLSDQPTLYSNSDVASYLSTNGYDTATNIIASITDSAPTTLDTLNELAAALGDDPNFATTVTNSIATKASLSGATFTGDVTFQGLATMDGITEVVNNKTGATGVVAHDFATGSIFYHTSLAADFTANITNVPTTNDRTIGVALVLNQGGTAYIPTALQIDGSAVTIKWADASVPSGNANQVDVVSFTLIRTGSAWVALGVLNTFG
jgi:hypothetical protein